jgi:protoporphyrinogen oxidase
VKKYDYVVVGAGVAGLTLAYQLSKNHQSVLLIEKDARLGGLAKSFYYTYQGKKFIFDLGPKRFHTDDQEVLQFIFEILNKEYLTTGRKSAVYLFKKYFDWPITTKDIFKLPFGIQAKVSFDIIKKIFFEKNQESDKFDQYIINKYGATLYHAFFKGYTEKFLQLKASQIHADWATTGINRSIIDKKAKGNSIFELLRSVILPSPVKTRFIYPKKQGFGYFCDRLAYLFKKQAGEIITAAKIEKINYQRSQLWVKGELVNYKQLVWTGNLLDLGKLLGENFSGLDYLSTIFYNFIIKKNRLRSDQWIYYGDWDLNMVRVSLEKNFASYLIPKGYSGVVVEKTCKYQDIVWNNPRQYLPLLQQELVQVGLIDNQDQIKKVYIEPIKDTYPIYHLSYKKAFVRVQLCMTKKYSRIKLLGRSGAFWYNNADHSIKAALGMARYLLGRQQQLITKDNIFSAKNT